MPYRNDPAYYFRRSGEERQRGDLAASPIAAAIHYDLAFRYAALAAEIYPRPKLTLVEGGATAPSPAGDGGSGDPLLSPGDESESAREPVSQEGR